MTSTSHPAADLGAFVRELAAFAQWSDADAEAVRGSASLVLGREAELTAAVYEHFLAHPAAARFFLNADGSPDTARLERRKHSLGRWLRETAEASLGADGLYGVLSIGIAHSHRSHGQGGAMPPELMIGAMSLLQTALARLLGAGMGDPRRALEASVAWNKLLLLQLGVLLHGYFMGWRAAGAPGPEEAR